MPVIRDPSDGSVRDLPHQVLDPRTGEVVGAPSYKERPLDLVGRELPDPTPVAPPVGYQRQPTMVELIRNMVRSERLRAEIEGAGAETFEEADDFEVGDDYEPVSEYDIEIEPPLPDTPPPSPGDPPAAAAAAAGGEEPPKAAGASAAPAAPAGQAAPSTSAPT